MAHATRTDRDLSTHRPWRPRAAFVALLLVAGAGSGVGCGSETTRPRQQLELGATRAAPIRLSYGDAARHRPYAPAAGDARAAEPVSPAVLESLGRARDCHGLGTVHVLAGKYDRAQEVWKDCVVGTDLDADLAGLAVLEGRHREAISLADRALAVQPNHGVALWNRALALEAVGDLPGAVETFGRVVELKDDWAAEAGQRAAALGRPR